MREDPEPASPEEQIAMAWAEELSAAGNLGDDLDRVEIEFQSSTRLSCKVEIKQRKSSRVCSCAESISILSWEQLSWNLQVFPRINYATSRSNFQIRCKLSVY